MVNWRYIQWDGYVPTTNGLCHEVKVNRFRFDDISSWCEANPTLGLLSPRFVPPDGFRPSLLALTGERFRNLRQWSISRTNFDLQRELGSCCQTVRSWRKRFVSRLFNIYSLTHGVARYSRTLLNIMFHVKSPIPLNFNSGGWWQFTTFRLIFNSLTVARQLTSPTLVYP